MVDINSGFVPSKARADAVATAALGYYALRLNYSQSYRGDPSIEIGDNLGIENDYGTSEVVVLEHVLKCDQNGLDGTVKGVG